MSLRNKRRLPVQAVNGDEILNSGRRSQESCHCTPTVRHVKEYASFSNDQVLQELLEYHGRMKQLKTSEFKTSHFRGPKPWKRWRDS
uniref:Ovule protein n=1 Tax=Ascaris lumbricoides TaxID=6252 RepID=A0A0M3I4C9_ASCLU